MKPLTRLVAVVLLSAACVARAAAPVAAAKPNVVFIICDDLGYGDVGPYGQKRIKTPNIDRLAKEGMLFTQGYSGSPVCAPSRSRLLTGQHTGRTPIRANPRYVRGWDRKQGDVPLPAEAATFPKLFKQAGYATAAIGKWGLGRPGTSGDPKNHGFDHLRRAALGAAGAVENRRQHARRLHERQRTARDARAL
ncbi:MAG: sulfatase-like hydrolase/transferase, partial [Planctomycetota bacterium]|nr:sulfatase-like hydrolase/transferase [Planctomycetota bacterium]